MELFSYLQTSDQKTSFTKVFLCNPKSPNQVWETGNRINSTGTGIIFPTYRILIKKLLLQNNLYLTWGAQNDFKKQEIELRKQEMELFFLLKDFGLKTVFYKLIYI